MLATQSIPREVKTSLDNPGSVGQNVFDTARNLGVSPQAVELLRKVRIGRDPVGDLFWKEQGSGRNTFAWRGGVLLALSPESCVASQDFAVRQYVLIPNDAVPVPQHLRDMLDVFCLTEPSIRLQMAA
ncbi:hypothetical protein [Burkholderia cenocepacia]|uniref:hypothetical protein n=1 Tax=Burkholderia cenocepacia TaxID=95486 RepID=UPI0007614222|nr:hypothetical protein [Burkholderia cenocepacia]